MSLKNPTIPPEIDPGTVRLVAPAPILAMWAEKNHGKFKLDIHQAKLERLSQVIGDREYNLLLELLS
jgi:hypothetical protein